MSADKKEQRTSKRYSIDGCAVQARESHLLGIFHKLSKKHMVLDISEGGIHFISREVFKEGKQLTLTLTAPFLKGELIEVQGRVARVKNLPGLSAYGVGVKFITLSEPDREKLKVLLENAAQTKGDISSYIDITATPQE